MFTSYEKIPESPRQWGLDEAGERTLAKVAWVVTEKIHGANFCLLSDGQRVQCANRKHLLAPDEEFFGYQRLLARLEEPARLAFALVRRMVPQARSVAIYGELFGGAYPHPDVPPDPLAQPVQTGVYYAPSIEFCAFDLAVEGPAGRVYLDDAPMRAVCREAGIFATEPLLTGPYSAALDFPVGFDSTIPRRLGLPPLAEPNRAEGVVIKPAQALLLPGARGPLRPVLKKKIAEFAEDQRYNGAQKWSTPRTTVPDPLDDLRWAAFNMVTQNRLRNAVSKIGPGRRGDGRHAQRLFRLLHDDILEQLSEEQGPALAALGPAQRQQLSLFIESELRTLLRASAQKDQ